MPESNEMIHSNETAHMPEAPEPNEALEPNEAPELNELFASQAVTGFTMDSPDGRVLHIVMRAAQRPVSTGSPREDMSLFSHCVHLTKMNGTPRMLGPREDPLPIPYANSRMLEHMARRHFRGRMLYLGVLRHANELQVFESLMQVGYDVMARSMFISPAIFHDDPPAPARGSRHLDA